MSFTEKYTGWSGYNREQFQDSDSDPAAARYAPRPLPLCLRARAAPVVDGLVLEAGGGGVPDQRPAVVIHVHVRVAVDHAQLLEEELPHGAVAPRSAPP